MAGCKQQVTFINCSDLETSRHFYADLLALPIAYAQPGFVLFFKVTESSFLAVCRRDVRSSGDSSGAMPAFICQRTEEVDEWGRRLVEAGVEVVKPAGEGRSSDGKPISAIYNLLVKDPAGYIVEFQVFLDPRWPKNLEEQLTRPDPQCTLALPVETKFQAPTNWKEWCVLVVDIQAGFLTEPVQEAFPCFADSSAGLVARARAQGVEVVHLREGSCHEKSPWFNFWMEMNPGKDSTADATAPCPLLRELGSEQVFVKYGYDGTGDHSGLTQYLVSTGKRAVLVCGMLTSCCVHLNASSLFLRGFQTYVVADCCADRTREMHTSTLARENRRSYCVVDLAAASSLFAAGPGFNLIACAVANATQFDK